MNGTNGGKWCDLPFGRGEGGTLTEAVWKLRLGAVAKGFWFHDEEESGRCWRRSGCDRPHQRFDPDDVDHPLHIVGEHLKTHFGFDLSQGPGQEVG